MIKKMYLIFLTLIIMIIAISKTPKMFDIIWEIIILVSIIRVFTYDSKFSFFSIKFWKIFSVIVIVYELIYEIAINTLLYKVNLDVNSLIGLVIIMPLYIYLFNSSFKRNIKDEYDKFKPFKC